MWAPKPVSGRDWLRAQDPNAHPDDKAAQARGLSLAGQPPWGPPGAAATHGFLWVLTSSPPTRLNQLIGQCTCSELTGAVCDQVPCSCL